MGDFQDLIDADAAGEERRRRPDIDVEDGIQYVRDVGHMKELISEVLNAAKPPKMDLEMWLKNKHRTVVLHEGPFSIEGVVKAPEGVTVPTFKWIVRRTLNKDLVGTAIHGFAGKQYSGRWELAHFDIKDGAAHRLDTKVAVKRMEGMSEEIIAVDKDQVFEGFQPRRQDVLNIAMVWIDAINAEDLIYDINGKPKDAPTVVVNNVGNATAQAPQVIILQAGQNSTVDELVALAQGKVRIETAPAVTPAEKKERTPAQLAHGVKLAEMARARAAEKKG